MTFVNATYVLATLVHISNGSAVIDPILTKHYGPNILGALIVVNNHFFKQIFFSPKNVWTKGFFVPKLLSNLIFLEQFGPCFLQTQFFYHWIIFFYIFGARFYLLKFVVPKKNLDLNS